MHQKTIRIPVEITFSTDPAELDDRQGETPATKESLLAYLKDAIQLGVDTEDQGQPEGAVFVAAGVDWDAAEPVDETANCDDAIRRTTEAGDEGTAAIKIQLPCYGITIHLDHAPTAGDPGCGKLTSNLKAADATAHHSTTPLMGWRPSSWPTPVPASTLFRLPTSRVSKRRSRPSASTTGSNPETWAGRALPHNYVFKEIPMSEQLAADIQIGGKVRRRVAEVTLQRHCR